MRPQCDPPQPSAPSVCSCFYCQLLCVLLIVDRYYVRFVSSESFYLQMSELRCYLFFDCVKSSFFIRSSITCYAAMISSKLDSEVTQMEQLLMQGQVLSKLLMSSICMIQEFSIKLSMNHAKSSFHLESNSICIISQLNNINLVRRGCSNSLLPFTLSWPSFPRKAGADRVCCLCYCFFLN